MTTLTDEVMIGLVIGAGLFAGAAILAGVSLWSRAGRTPSARWWVYPRSGPALTKHYGFDAFALVLLPMLAETAFALGFVVILGPILSPISGITLAFAVIAGSIQFGLFIFARLLCWRRWILPLWVYPAWLKETRRAEAEMIPPEMRMPVALRQIRRRWD